MVALPPAPSPELETRAWKGSVAHMARVAERRVTENEDIGFKLLNKKVSSSDRENKGTRTIEECQGWAGEHEVGRDR